MAHQSEQMQELVVTEIQKESKNRGAPMIFSKSNSMSKP